MEELSILLRFCPGTRFVTSDHHSAPGLAFTWVAPGQGDNVEFGGTQFALQISLNFLASIALNALSTQHPILLSSKQCSVIVCVVGQ